MSDPKPELEIVLDLVEKTYRTRDRLTGVEQDPLPLPEGEMPWQLVIRPGEVEASAIEVAVNDDTGPAFAPNRASSCSVLAIDAWITDKVFETVDDTLYVVRVVNTSTHYVAEEICVHVELDPKCDALGILLPDGNRLLEIQPGHQCIKCLRLIDRQHLHPAGGQGSREGPAELAQADDHRLLLAAHVDLIRRADPAAGTWRGWGAPGA